MQVALDAVLSVTTGTLVVRSGCDQPVKDLVAALWQPRDVTARNVWEAREHCESELLRQHPWLEEVDTSDMDPDWEAWLKRQEELHGESLEVELQAL